MAKTHHLLLITTSFPDAAILAGRDAAGAFVADFASALAQQIRVTVLAPSYTANCEQAGNLTIRRFVVPQLPLSLLRPTNPQHWWPIVTTLWAGQQAVRQLCRVDRPDHILALWALPSGWWARNQGQQASIPYSVWALGSDIWTLGKLPLIRTALKTTLRQSYACFADGYLLKEDVEKLAGRACEFLPSARHLPLAHEKPLRATPPYRLAYLGRWHPNKGVDLLLDSLDHLDAADWQRIAEVRIGGGGPLAEVVQRKTEHLCAAGHPVSVTGYLNRAEAAALFTWADYVLLPSRLESIPVVFSDAMQCRAPVVCTPVGDLPRLLQEHQVGLCSRAVTASAFADALRLSLQHSPADFAPGLGSAAALFQVTTAAQQLLHRLNLAARLGTAPPAEHATEK